MPTVRHRFLHCTATGMVSRGGADSSNAQSTSLLFPIVVIGLYLMSSMQFNFGDMLKSKGGDGQGGAGGANDAAEARVSRSAAAVVNRSALK